MEAREENGERASDRPVIFMFTARGPSSCGRKRQVGACGAQRPTGGSRLEHARGIPIRVGGRFFRLPAVEDKSDERYA